MSLKPGVATTAWNPANDPSFSGLQVGGANLVKTNKVPVYENKTILSGRNP
jgi:hypothetical protein